MRLEDSIKVEPGKFDRIKADNAGLSVEEKKQLSSGIDVVRGETTFEAQSFRSQSKKVIDCDIR